MGEPKIVVVDYHKGNLSSVARGLVRAGAAACTSDDPEQIRRASLLYSGSQVEVLQEGWAAANYPGYTFLSLAARANETQPLPDAADTVVKLELR